MKTEKFPVSDELAELHDKMLAAQELRDRYVKIPFGYKKAMKAASEVEKFKRKFWQGVRNCYPEYNHFMWSSYLPSDQTVQFKDDPNE